MDYLDDVARRVSELSLADLDSAALTAAKTVVLDTLGAIAAGSARDENAALARWVAGRGGGGSTLIGHSRRAEPLLATLVNGTAGVALEVDEGNRHGGGHPAVHVVPAALAAAEEIDAPPVRFLEAVIAGYEVLSRMGSATRLRASVHPHGTFGAIGAAVATAKILGYPEADVRAVISLAASMSPGNSWTPCFEGATIRNLYPGRSGLLGMLAAHLRRCGFTALRDGPGDVFGHVLGEAFDPARLVDGWGAPFRIQQGYFKLHACCLYNHAPPNLMHEIRRDATFAADDVERIDVRTFPVAAGLTDPAPQTMLGAKFSIPYAIAAGFVLGRTDAAAFERPAREDRDVRALAARVKLTTDEHMSLAVGGGPLARVSVSLRDGRCFERTATTLRGDATDPVPRQEVVDKFLALAGPVLGDGPAAAVVQAVDGLDGLPRIAELARLLG